MDKPFPYSSTYTAIAIAYKNQSLIADLVLPRVAVGTKEFKHWEYPALESITLPDTRVPRRGKPNEVEFTAIERTASCEDFGLDDIIPNDDIKNAPQGVDPLGHAIENLTNLVLLGREIRVASLIFSPTSYENTLALSGSDQFSDFLSSDPIAIITEALDTPLLRPNTMTIGRKAFSVLARHPRVVKAAHGNSGDSGIATRAAIAELFELKDVFVGESFVNVGKKGQPAEISRVWGNHIALTYIDPLARPKSGITFGFTAQYENRIAGSRDFDAGLHGSQLARVGESVKEVVCAKGAGFLLQNVI